MLFALTRLRPTRSMQHSCCMFVPVRSLGLHGQSQIESRRNSAAARYAVSTDCWVGTTLWLGAVHCLFAVSAAVGPILLSTIHKFCKCSYCTCPQESCITSHLWHMGPSGPARTCMCITPDALHASLILCRPTQARCADDRQLGPCSHVCMLWLGVPVAAWCWPGVLVKREVRLLASSTCQCDAGVQRFNSHTRRVSCTCLLWPCPAAHVFCISQLGREAGCWQVAHFAGAGCISGSDAGMQLCMPVCTSPCRQGKVSDQATWWYGSWVQNGLATHD